MLVIDDIHVSIQSVVVLRGMSMTVADGSMVGLVGRNGAGKTTLMRSVMGHLAPARAASASTAMIWPSWPSTHAPNWASATCPKTVAWCPS